MTSQIQVDTIVNAAGTGTPTLSQGAILGNTLASGTSSTLDWFQQQTFSSTVSTNNVLTLQVSRIGQIISFVAKTVIGTATGSNEWTSVFPSWATPQADTYFATDFFSTGTGMLQAIAKANSNFKMFNVNAFSGSNTTTIPTGTYWMSGIFIVTF